MPEQRTLYLLKLSPYGQKVELALVEANTPYKAYRVDPFTKPEWFTSKVNPVGKFPAVTYGGPDVDPEDPSPLSAKISESNTILEFVADLYPDSWLLPKDPIQGSDVCFFVKVTTKHIEGPFYAFLRRQESYENVLKDIECIQELLEEGKDFAVGDHYTIADACITPHLARIKIAIETDLGKFPVGMGYKLGEELKGPKFAKFMGYVERMLERPSLKQMHGEESVITLFKTKLAAERAQ